MAYSENGINGAVSYNKEIITSVVKIATMEVAGVSSLCDNFGTWIKRLINYRYNSGVVISKGTDGVVVNIYINVFYGNNITLLASKVQKNVKNAITTMLNINISKINVHVLGVNFKAEPQLQTA